MGGAGIMEYRSAGGVGPFTSLLRCCMEGGLDWCLARMFSTIWTFAMPDFGFDTRRLFSCSSLASSNAVDCITLY